MGILTQLITSGEDIRTILISICFYIPCILLALILHECAHGVSAGWCGDDTARREGRITLNPLAHLTLSGTVCMLLLGFGWARPVPVDPGRMKHRRRDMIIVSLAGIITNFLLFLFSTALCVLLTHVMLPDYLLGAGLLDFNLQDYVCADGRLFGFLYYGEMPLFISQYQNSITQYFPLFSTSVTLNVPWLQHIIRFFMIFGLMNISLAIFNFLPVPPLDGYNFWNYSLFKGRIRLTRNAMIAILIVFYALILFGDRIFGVDPLSWLITAVQSAVGRFFISLFGF